MFQKKYIIISVVISFVITSITFFVLGGYSYFYKLDNDLLKTSFFYYFSTNAQVLAALLGIGLAAFYTTMTNLKSTIHTVYMEPLLRLMMSDITLKTTIYQGAASILISIISLVWINLICKLKCLLLITAELSLFLSISTLYLLIVFIFVAIKSYMNPTLLIEILLRER